MSQLLTRLMRRAWLVAGLAFCLSALVLSAFFWNFEQRRQESLRATLLSLATDHAQSVESRIDRLLSTTYLMAAVVRKDGGRVIDFHSVADEILPFFPGIASLSLSPGGVIRYAAPKEGNEGSIGFNQLQDPLQSPEAFLARDTGQLTLAGPLNLVQGGIGVVGRLPIFLNGSQGQREFWGFVNVAIRFPDALQATGLESLAGLGYAYELWRIHPRTNERQVIAGSAPTAALDPVNKQLDVPNAQWTLSLAPTQGWITPSRWMSYASLTALLSALLGYLAHLWASLFLQRSHLEALVSERTAQITATQDQLRATLDALPDLLFEIDGEGRLRQVHAGAETWLALPPAQMAGRLMDEVLPGAVCEVLRDVMADARANGRSLGREYQVSLAAPGETRWFEVSAATKKQQDPLESRFIVLSRNISRRKRTEQALAASQERLDLAIQASRDAPWDWNLTSGELYLSPQWWQMLGEAPHDPGEAQAFWERYVHPEDVGRIRERLMQLVGVQEKSYVSEFRLRRSDGNYFPVLSRALITYDADGVPIRISGTLSDLTEVRRAQRRERLRTFLLDLLTQDLSLPGILEQTALKLENSLPGALCSILLLDDEGTRLHHGAGPSLPASFMAAINGSAIGPREGSCGAAAFLGQVVVAEDLSTHPNWENYRELATQAGLASCWSQPIIAHGGKVLGSFAVYHRQPGSPAADELLLLEEAARFTALAIERKRDEAALELAAAVFEQSSEAFLITDAEQRIVKINPAFSRITGYSAEEVMGQTPRVLSSGHQGREFYQAMWHSIETSGQWQGEIWNRRKDGQVYPEWLSITRVQDGEGLTRHYIAIFSDTSQRRAHEAQIRALAHYDALTGLANRTLLRERLDHDLSQAKRHRQPLTLLFLDLDHFKNINDSLGHHLGDLLLVEVAQRLKSMVREQDTVARLGGDEFVAVLPDTNAQGAAHIAQKLLARIAEPYQLEQHELSITPSIGLALYPNDGADYQTLYRCADTAMYRAKQDGRNGYSFFTAEMQASSIRTLQLDNALRRALERDQFHLHFQPQVCLKSGRIIGAEALLRWDHPEWGPVSPAEFIPVAESSGQILQIGEWVLRTATRQLKAWMDDGLPAMVMAVNLSAVQFRLPHLPDAVMDILRQTGLPPECLELELTESVAMHDPQSAIATMNRLHDCGILMSVDDFGTGYSSLNYLKRFRVYKLKIDQSFVRDMCNDPEDALIVGAIINLAQSMGLKTIAEGVEDADQLALLRARGCAEVQGYHIARPMPAAAFEAWVRQRLDARMTTLP